MSDDSHFAPADAVSAATPLPGGRTPSAALRRDSKFLVDSGIETQVQLTDLDWDSDNMIQFDHGTTIKITPQRTGLYAIKAGGRWFADDDGRRVMDLRWVGPHPVDDDHPVKGHVIIARDEKGPNEDGECGHSLSADVLITDTSSSPSPRVRKLGPKTSVELVVYQTSGGELELRPDVFLQMIYQGPKP
jgi:hypothetical protein